MQGEGSPDSGNHKASEDMGRTGTMDIFYVYKFTNIFWSNRVELFSEYLKLDFLSTDYNI